MDVNPVGGGLSRFTKVKTYGKEEPHIETPQDSFQKMPPSNFKNIPSSLVNQILKAKGLEKGKYNFKVVGMVRGSDGSLFVAYSDPMKRDGNYISAVSPQGEIMWETSAGSSGIESIKMGSDDILYVKTEKNLQALHTDSGRVKFLHSFDDVAKGHWVDSSGNNYFQDSSGSLYGVDSEGRKFNLPPEVRTLSLDSVKKDKGDTLLAKEGNNIYHIDLSKGKVVSKFQVKDPDKEETPLIEDFSLTSDGSLMVLGKFVTTINTHSLYGDLHRGLGFGRLWGPHLPRDDQFFYTTIETNNVYKLNPQGSVEWKKGDIGPTPHILFTQKGFYFAGDVKDKEGFVEVKRINAKGDIESFAKVEGYISRMMESPNGDIVIHHGSKISGFNASGKLKFTYSLDEDASNKRMYGIDGDKFILEDYSKGMLYRWDPKEGDMSPLTDHTHDYSYKKMVERGEEFFPNEQKEERRITVQDEYVSIGKVRLRKRK